MTTVTLDKDVTSWIADYKQRHEANYTTVENTLNSLLATLGGPAANTAVPQGLQEIYDRAGGIGVGSYDFSEGVLSGPAYNLSVAAGAFWSTAAFRVCGTATDISLSALSTDTYYLTIDAGGNPTVTATPGDGGDTIRQFAWDAGTHTVSAKALYAGISILFDGDDYADMLTSTARALTFEKVADRLEGIEQLLDPFASYYAQGTHSGLDFYYLAGKVRNDSAISDTVAGFVSLADDSTNYVEVDPATGTVSDNVVGYTSGLIALYTVTTAAGVITGVTDDRTAAIAGTGGGGGHTQGTDLGTTATDFLIDSDASGSPTGRAGIEVENGADPNAAIKFNRDTGNWEFTTDGGATWTIINDVDLSLGSQELTKYVPVEDPSLVHNEAGRGSSVAYEPIDLTAYLCSPPFGVAAVALRVFFKDSTPGTGTKVLFKKGGGIPSPATAFTCWSDESAAEKKPADLIVPLADDYTIDFYVFASGAASADLSVYLLGYYETVAGVGTQKRTFTQASLAVAASTVQLFNLTNFINRGITFSLQIEETGGLVTGTYDVGVYAKDTCGGAAAPDIADADKLYIAQGIDPAADSRVYEDFMGGWRIEDEDASNELHLKINNSDAGQAAEFTVTVVCEQFA